MTESEAAFIITWLEEPDLLAEPGEPGEPASTFTESEIAQAYAIAAHIAPPKPWPTIH